jgi:superfamily II DNA or RNA helicase
MENKHFFEHFRRQRSFDNKARSHPNVFFQIDFDDHGAYLTVVDAKGRPIEANYLAYSGAVRNVLRAIEQIQEKNSFVIDWEKPPEQIYLADHDHLLTSLRRSGNVIDKDRNALAFAEGEGRLRVQLIPENEETADEGAERTWRSKVSLLWEDAEYEAFQLLSEQTALSARQIVELAPVGGGFRNVPYFSTRVREPDLPVFLSLLFSYLDNVELRFEDYRVVPVDEKVIARPALIFEKIAADEALFMRVGQVLADMDVHVLEQFDLYRYAEINDLEKTIAVKYIEQEPVEEVFRLISRLLKKHTPKGAKAERPEVIQEGDLFIIPAEIASGFIYNELPDLLTQFQVYGSEKLKSYKITAVQPSLNLKLSHGIDFLEGDAMLEFGEEKINLFDALAQLRKNHYVKLSDGTHALVNEAYLRKLERVFNKKGKDKVELSFFDLPLVEELIEEKTTGAEFRQSKAIFEGFNELKSRRYRVPELNAELRPYQKDGFKWLRYLQEHQLGGCLADDMGLGKTLQAIAILATVYPQEQAPSLIIMPRSLLFNWRAEVNRFAPQLTHYTYYGPDRNLEEAQQANLIFTTYATMRNDIEALKELSFLYIILDESQNIKNIQAQTTKAVMLLESKHRLALSGTPIENNLGELYSLFRFLNPAMFGPLQRFNKHYLTPIQKNNDKAAIRQLRKKIYPFILRRLKKDVLQDLPDKIEQTLYVEMSDEQRRLYEQRRQFYQSMVRSQIAEKGVAGSRFFIFQALNELRQIATVPENFSDGAIASPKLELLQEQLADTIANGHKALIFVNFLAAIELIGSQLNEMGVDFVSMTGATRDRQSLVQKFQQDPNCRVFLMTLKTGGTGLNLTAADTIFIFDPWWNVAAENQAIDRAHRIGQENKVLAYKLIAQGSIEEKILQLQQIKKELFDNIISADSGTLKSLTEEDIDYILS